MRLATFINKLSRTAQRSGHRFISLPSLLIALSCLITAPNALADWVDTASPGQQTTALGAKPTAIALDTPARRGVVLSDSSATLINLDSGRITATIALSEEPEAVITDPSRNLAYVLHESGKISVLNLTTQTRQASFTVPGELKTAVLAANGAELIIAIDEGKSLIRVSTANGQVLQRIALAFEPQALVLSPDEKRLFVATEDRGIRVFDTSTWREVGSISLSDVKAMAWWSSGNRLVATNSDGVNLIDLATLSVANRIPTGAGLRDLALDDAKGLAYATDKENNSIAVIDLRARSFTGRYRIESEPKGIAYDPNTSALLVTLKKEGKLLRILPASASLTSVLLLTDRLRDVVVDNTAFRAFAIGEKAANLVSVNLADRTLTKTPLGSKPKALAVDEVKKLVLVATEKNTGLMFYDQITSALFPERIKLDEEVSAIAVDSTRAIALALEKDKARLHFIGTGTRTLLKTLSLPAKASAVAVHPGLGHAYVLTKDRLQQIDLDSRTLIKTVNLSSEAERIAIDETLKLAVIVYEDKNRVEVFNLTTLTVVKSFTNLAKHPSTLAINPLTHIVALASKDADQIALIDLNTQTLTPAFSRIDKPGNLAISTRLNQALVISGESGELNFIQLPNPVPVLSELIPAEGDSNTTKIVAVGERFVDSSRIAFNGVNLVTRWVDARQLEADLPASITQKPATYSVNVVTPQPGGGSSNALNFVVRSSTPSILSVSPTEIPAGSAERSISITGSQFVALSVVSFNAQNLATRFVSATQLSAVVPTALLATAGTYPVLVTNPGGVQSNSVNVNVVGSGPTVASINPTSGEPGVIVTISGAGFDPSLANNKIAFSGNVAATALSGSATQLTVTVPPAAGSGPIAITTPRGTVNTPTFTIRLPQDFTLVASPAPASLIQGAATTLTVQLSSIGTQAFNSLVRLSATGLPAGVTAEFTPATITGGQLSNLVLKAQTGVAAQTYSFTISGAATLNGRTEARTISANVNVLRGNQTGVKGRFVDPDGRGIAGIYVRHEALETTSDVAGNFVILGLPVGQVTLRLDATPANPLYPIWPYQLDTQANQVVVLADWVISPPPTDDKFMAIVANAPQDQALTDSRFPGVKFTIPAGVTIIGWDGVPKNRMAVERIDVNKLPVPPPPVPIKESYQLYFGTPMGGVPNRPIPVTLPNVANLEPGDKSEIWYFDGSPLGGSGEWKLAGTGTIDPDGKTVTTDPGQGIPRFCGVCGLASQACPPPPKPNPPPKSCPTSAGKPIDLFTGQELASEGDLSCGGVVPINIGRTYHPVDSFNNRAGTTGSLGFGWTLSYDIALLPFTGPQKRIIMPGGVWVDFTDQGGGNFTNSDYPSFDGAVMRATNAAANEWEVRFRDQRIWRFKPFPGITGVIRGGPPTFLVEQVDTNGNTLFITRSPEGHVRTVGTQQRSVSMTYGTNNFINKITDSIGRTVEFTYNAANRIENVTDSSKGLTKYTYVDDTEFPANAACPIPTDGLRIKTITHPDKATLTDIQYGTSRRALRQTSYLGEFKFAYKVTGACVVNVSNPGAKCFGPSCPDTDSLENFQAGWRIYGGQVVATTVTDPRGNISTNRFNPDGLVTENEDSLAGRTKSRYDANNRVTQSTDTLGRTMKFEYYSDGSLQREYDQNNRVTEYSYDTKWNKTASITRYDDTGNPLVSNFTYATSNGNLLSSTDPLNRLTKYTYTAQGRLETITDPRGKVTKFEYNSAGDPISITDPLGNTMRSIPDAAGRTVEVIDQLGFSTRVKLNARDQTEFTIDPMQGMIKFEYDPRGNLKTVIDRANRIIESNLYNERDFLEKRIDAASKVDTYTYDGSGNLKTRTDRLGQTRTFGYDAENRLVLVTFADGSSQSRTFDAVGRLANVANINGTISYQYDNLDRLTQVSTPQGTIRYTYDALDRRKSMTTPKQVVSYEYDKASNLTKIAQGSETIVIDYYPDNRRKSITLPNGVIGNYGYDDAGRLTSLTYQKGATVTEQLTYRYDAKGNIINRSRGNGSAKQEKSKNATYDVITGRLITLNGESFQYDDKGRLTQRTGPGGVVTYDWNALDQLIGISGPGLTASFKYDALGRRIEKIINGQLTAYLYDSDDIVAEIGVVNSAILRTNNIDEAIARYSAEGDRYYLSDNLGSTVSLTDKAGTSQTSYNYSPYGETQQSGSDNQSSQYTGRENDGTGLYYYRARYYSPELSRFISEDPIGIAGGINLYAYVDGNPILYRDPTGLVLETWEPSGGSPPTSSQEAPDFTPCNYYQQVCTQKGCSYHCNAEQICRGAPTIDSIGANGLLSLCGASEANKNCIRRCLVSEDQKARKKPKCKTPPKTAKCQSPDCTDKSCIDDYHNYCFTQCGVGYTVGGYGNVCYGGNTGYPYTSDN